MEIMWDISFIPKPLAKPTPWHTSCPVVQQAFWAKTSNHHKPWPRMRISIPVLGRRNSGVSQEKRVIHYWAANTLQKQKKFPIKDRKKTKKRRSSRSKIGRKQKKKESSRSKIGRKQKENIQKGLRTRQYVNKHTELSQANKKREETTAWEFHYLVKSFYKFWTHKDNPSFVFRFLYNKRPSVSQSPLRI